MGHIQLKIIERDENEDVHHKITGPLLLVMVFGLQSIAATDEAYQVIGHAGLKDRTDAVRQTKAPGSFFTVME